MNKLILVVGMIFLASCSRVSVEAGQQAVLVSKPWFFGHGGVDKTPVVTGSVITAWSTDAVPVVMTPLLFEETFDDIMPRDNNPVDYHASVRLQVTDSVRMVEKFGLDVYKNNIQKPFQTMNRNQVRQYSMPELALQQDVVIKVEKELEAELSKFLKDNDIPMKVLGVALGKISPQKAIIEAYNETGVQQQRSKTEAMRANAEDQRKIAETKRAIADRAYQDNLGVSVEQYIRLQQIKVCGEKQNCSMFIGASPTPMLSVK